LNEAIAALDQGADGGADKLAIYSAKARILRASGQNEMAVAAWKLALAAKPDDLEIALELAAERRAAGQHPDALAAYQAIADDQKVSPAQRRDAALEAGRIARDQMGDGPAAKRSFDIAFALDPDHLPATCELANQLRISGSFEEAEKLYRRALLQQPANLWPLSGLAVVRRLMGDPNEARELAEKALAIDPEYDWTRVELGYALRDLGRVEEAAATMEKIDPSSVAFAAACGALGHFARASGDHASASKFYEEAAAKAADPADALFHLAGAKQLLGDLCGAREAISRLLERDRNSYQGWMADGTLRRAMSDRPGARAAFLHAAAIRPAEAWPHVEIAAEDIDHGNFDAAAAALEIALIIDPRHEEAQLRKAGLLAAAGEVGAALALYTKLQIEHPGSIWAYLSAAQLLSKKAEFAAALTVLAMAREKCRPHALIEAEETSIFRAQGLLGESYQKITEVSTRFPLDFSPWYLRTSAAIDLGYFDVAETLLAAPPSQLSIQEQGQVLKLCAKLASARWSLETAIEDLSAAIKLDANDTEASYDRAKLRLITFDVVGAWADLKARADAQSRPMLRKPNPMHSHVGQLYEEYVLDAKLTAEFPNLLGNSQQDRLARLVELVRCFPDSTAPAIGLMLALRRTGGFDISQGSPQQPSRIPLLVTQFWNDPEPPHDVILLMSSWDDLEPAFKFERFDDSTAMAYLQQRCEPSVSSAFGRTGEPAQRADLFRLARLFVEGGYFIDADDRARGGFSSRVPPSAEFFAHQEDLGSIGNNVLGAVPRHPVIGLALNEAVAAILRGDRDIVWLTTGPGLLTRSFARWLTDEPKNLRSRVDSTAILTLAEMRSVVAIHCHAAYKTTNRAWLSGAFRKRDRK
jgi:tetratricopeptide (TPR) repeat protein